MTRRPSPDWERARELLQTSNVATPESFVDTIETYLALIERWNDVAGLVSASQLAGLWDHVIDSASLAPCLVAHHGQAGTLYDAGSGGGFPAIPLAILLPNWRMTMVERSEKKCAFLHKVLSSLQLPNAWAICSSFEDEYGITMAGAWTARALEKPEVFLRKTLKKMGEQTAFWCQFANTGSVDRKMFHVEQIEDEWTHSDLRRGHLYRITKHK